MDNDNKNQEPTTLGTMTSGNLQVVTAHNPSSVLKTVLEELSKLDRQGVARVLRAAAAFFDVTEELDLP